MRHGVRVHLSPATVFDREDACEQAIAATQADDRPRGVVELPRADRGNVYLVLDLAKAERFAARTGYRVVGEFR